MAKTLRNIILYIDKDIKSLGRFVAQTGFESMNIVGVICKNADDEIKKICFDLNIRLFNTDENIHYFAKLSKVKAVVLLDFYIKPSDKFIRNWFDKGGGYYVINCVPSNRIFDAKHCTDNDIYQTQIARSSAYNYNYAGIIIYNYMTNDSYYSMQVPIYKGDTSDVIKGRVDPYKHKFYPSIVEQVMAGTRK